MRAWGNAGTASCVRAGSVDTLQFSMNQFSDQSLAKRMLEMREHGFAFSRLFRRNIKTYLLFALMLSMMAALGAWSGNWMWTGIAFGIFLGGVSSHIGAIRGVTKSLPFSLKVTDWDKVRRLANGENVA